jgi:hypothetical protein
MGFIVVGLSQSANVEPLRDALKAAALDADRLDVIDGGDIDLIPGAMIGSELLTSDGGASVPGINSGSGVTVKADDSLIGRLGDFNIPDGESDNYLEALGRGRSVVAYSATSDTVGKVIEAFRAAGLLNVKQF